MKNIYIFSLVSMVFLCSVCHSQAQDRQERVWINPERYKIVLLKPVGGEWASGFNELILLDSDTGQTWTLKSKSLKDGWISMPRKEEPEKKP